MRCAAAEVVKAKHGQNTMLPCPYQHSITDVVLLRWAKISEEGSEELIAEMVKHVVSDLGSTRYNISSDLSLTVKSVSFRDAGIYQCYVTSVDASASSSHDVILQVDETSNETIKGHVGESVTFPCPSSSDTRNHTNAYWKKYSHGLSQGSPNATFHHGTTTPGYTVDSDDFSLTIEEISPNDEGVYKCYQPGIEMTGSVLHTVYCHTYALPKTSLHIDGCESDERNTCEQIILVGTVALFTCKVENVYPENYPTWSDQTEYRDKSINSDGTFNTWSSITVLLNDTDTPAERVCTFVLEGFNMSSQLTIRGMSQVFTALISSEDTIDLALSRRIRRRDFLVSTLPAAFLF
ncbi:uncharacterized protein [Diadema setosum]|uniref:uncharacterized protein n=1 Tax=Diadema setosum TaxID=31175 RepID=UPI003B3AB4AC